MIDQFRQVMRRLMRTPMFTAIVLLTLAIGVGANTAIFSVIEGVLLKPLPYPQPDRLIGIWHKAPGINIPELNMCPSFYFIDREQSTTLEDVGVYDGDAFTITGQGEPEHIRGLDVTDGTLPLLGVRPALGRLFTKRDDTANAPATAVISYGYWQKKFGSDPNVIGRNITADGKPREIIGVLPRSFQFLDYQDVDLVIPMQWDRSKTKLGNFSYEALARMKPGVTVEQASADIGRMIPIAIRSFPAPDGFNAKIFDDAHITPNLHLLKQDVVGDVGKALWVLMGSIGVVLLVACANVANLLLVRVEGRRQEIAIRSALGAGYGRISLDLLIESLTLGMLGSVIGLALAFGALRLLIAAAPTGLPRIHDIGIDMPVLLFTLGIAVLVSLLIGLIPVLKYARGAINQDLREGGRGLSQGRERHRIRKALVVMQVSLALVLLICSGLMIRTFYALMHVSPGFADPNTVQSFRIYIPEARIPDTQSERIVREEKAILDKLSAISGVTSVSMTSAVPMSNSRSSDVLYAEDHPLADTKIPPIRRFKYIAPGSFKTMGTPVIAGRDYTWDDELQHLPVAIISENFAQEYWGSAQNAIGKRIRVASTDDWRQIVGVVRNVYDDGVSQDPPTSVYWPIWRTRFEGQPDNVQRGLAFIIRTDRAGSENFMAQARQAVWSVDSDLPLSNVSTLGEFYTKSMARTSFTLVMLVVAAAMALLLGIIGIYGVIAYSVSQRTREIGIRMALGAQRPSLTAMFVRQGMLLSAIGAVIGIGTAFGVMRLMASLLYHVSPMDPMTYGGTTLVILGISWIACYLPSRRAATVDPVHALRAE